jgi:6-phosphogluconate dehydrogenase
MQIAVIGLGGMSSNIVRRLMRAGHECIVYDVRSESVAQLAGEGAVGVASMEELAAKLKPPRAVWMMLPAAVVDDAIAALSGLLKPDDVLIDGGNSYYRHDIARAKALEPKGIHYVDVGTSGGIWGLERGFCQMIGGEQAIVQRLDPIFAALAPAMDSTPRTPGARSMPPLRSKAICVAAQAAPVIS